MPAGARVRHPARRAGRWPRAGRRRSTAARRPASIAPRSASPAGTCPGSSPTRSRSFDDATARAARAGRGLAGASRRAPAAALIARRLRRRAPRFAPGCDTASQSANRALDRRRAGSTARGAARLDFAPRATRPRGHPDVFCALVDGTAARPDRPHGPRLLASAATASTASGSRSATRTPRPPTTAPSGGSPRCATTHRVAARGRARSRACARSTRRPTDSSTSTRCARSSSCSTRARSSPGTSGDDLDRRARALLSRMTACAERAAAPGPAGAGAAGPRDEARGAPAPGSRNAAPAPCRARPTVCRCRPARLIQLVAGTARRRPGSCRAGRCAAAEHSWSPRSTPAGPWRDCGRSWTSGAAAAA